MYQDYSTGNLGQVFTEGVKIDDRGNGDGKVITWRELEFALRTLREATKADGGIPELPGFSGFSKYANEHLGATANMVQVIKHDMHYRTKNGKAVAL